MIEGSVDARPGACRALKQSEEKGGVERRLGFGVTGDCSQEVEMYRSPATCCAVS
jgi:hypothetical protein